MKTHRKYTEYRTGPELEEKNDNVEEKKKKPI
jgi:hypothetical protein